MSENRTYFIVSLIFHVGILLVLILSFEFTAPLMVVENTNKNDVISAVVLGDTEKSKIVTPSTPPPIEPQKPLVKAVENPKPTPKIEAKDVIALKTTKPTKPTFKKIKQEQIFGKDLLADLNKLKKQTEKKKIQQQKDLQKQFQTALRQQTEKSMRQQLVNENIHIKGSEVHQAQGIVNKYQALIQQAISEHWIVPSQVNKKLYCVLLIHLAPGGMVTEVRVIRSSGDTALDNSARAAVMKASPLPVPKEADAFELFREFNLKVKPENILNDG